jgi:phage shock protein PspC (stress-responsive transcriptional regulator)
MAPPARGPEDSAMTTEQPDAAQPLDQAAGARRLRRRTSDRVIGGVAGGLGDYLNVDPVLLRAAFAGLMIFGGAGLVIYVLGWLLIPEAGHEHSIVEAAIRNVAGRTGRLGLVVLVFATIAIASPWVTDPYRGVVYIQAEVFWALAIVLVGVVLLLPQGRTRAGEPRASAIAAAPMLPSPTEAAIAAHWGPAVAAPPRERSPLGWYVLAGVLVVLAVLAVVGNLAPVRVAPGQYFGAGLLALGLGLIVGAWWGRARLLILLGILVLPAAAISAFLTVPLEGGIADDDFRPENVSEVQPAYHLLGGRLRLDLTALEAGSNPVNLSASVGIGDLYVIVPTDANVQVAGSVQGGQLDLFGRDHAGTGLADRVSQAGVADGPTLVLTLDVGIGSIWVDRVPVGDFE